MPPAASSPYGAVTVWLFLSSLAFYVPLTRGHFLSTDEVGLYQQTRSLSTSDDLSTDVIPNTFPGRDGLNCAPYGPGQSLLAVPLYGLGTDAARLLNRLGPQTWLRVFAGPRIAGSRVELWGGRIQIFFVNIFNCIAVPGRGGRCLALPFQRAVCLRRSCDAPPFWFPPRLASCLPWQ